MRPGLRKLGEGLFLALLLCVSFRAVRDHSRDDSPTMDEPYHTFAAAEYVLNGTYWVNLEHPPLTKDLAGFAIQSLDLVPPAGGDTTMMTPHNSYNNFLYRNRADADRLISTARRPFTWVFLLLIVATYAIARMLFGAGAAMLAAGLIALDPTFVAHAGVVHTDVSATLTITVAAALALLALRTGKTSHWIAVGVAIGIALVTKFSAIVLIPAIVILVFARNLRLGRQALGNGLVGAAAAFGIALIVVSLVYAWNMRNMPKESATKAVQLFLVLRRATDAEINHHAMVSAISPPIGHWYAGIKGVALLSNRGRGVNYFHGRISERGFPLYFPAAFLFKSTPAFLVLLLLALVLAWRSAGTFTSLALILPGALIFLLGIGSAFNIGVRHILPIYPPLAIIAAGALTAALPPRWFAIAAATILLAATLSLARIHPFEFGYYNALAGGPQNGRKWFVDSSTDWGQDLKRLGGYLRASGLEGHTTVVAFSGLATNYYARCKVLDPTRPVEPGHYAISVLMQAIGPPYLRELNQPEDAALLERVLRELRNHGTRVATVGTSIDLFQLPRSNDRVIPSVADIAPLPACGERVRVRGAGQGPSSGLRPPSPRVAGRRAIDATDRPGVARGSRATTRSLPNEPHTSQSSDRPSR